MMNREVTNVTDGHAAGNSLLPVLIKEQQKISEALMR